MTIRLETSKNTGIKNFQDKEISAFERNWAKDLPKQFPQAKARTAPSALYNCHGLTFASRRTKIISRNELGKILTDDRYEELEITEVQPGDIVVYFSETGDAAHSGIVVEYHPPTTLLPIICSKWGKAGEFIHALLDCPEIYGRNYKFYRCRL